MSQAATTRPRPTTAGKPPAAPKTKRIVNVPLLAVSLAVIVVGGALAGLWHRYQSNQVADTFLQRATALEEAGKWPEAANYFARYLQLEPADTDARLRLVAAVEKSDASGPGRYRLVTLLYQTLGELPERDDLRLKLAEQLLSLHDVVGAKTQATKLLESDDQQTKIVARRIRALSISAQARPDGLVTMAEAATALRESLADNSGDVEIAAITANVYRAYPDLVGPEATPQRADEIIDAMVAANPTDASALLARYQYRLRFDPQHAPGDLEAALKLEPDNVTAHLLSVESIVAARDMSRLETAKRSSLRVIELQPQDPRGYLTLARVRGLAGDTRGAAEILHEGRKQLPAVNLELEYMLASVLLDQNKVDEARTIATEFSGELDKLLPEMTTDGRVNLENKRRLLQGRLAISDGDLPQAAREFEAIIASTAAANAAISTERVLAHDLLAAILSQQHRPDLAAAHWAEVAKRLPNYGQSAWKAGKASLEAGRTDVAIGHLQNYLQQPGALPEAQLTMLQAQLQQELSRPPAERNWTSFLETLETVRTAFPNSWEWRWAEVVHAMTLNTPANRDEVLARLHEIEKQFPQEAEVSERLVAWYQQLGETESVERVLTAYDKQQPNVVRRVTLRSTVLASQNQLPEAIALLDQASESATPADANEIALVRLKLLLATQQLEQAQEFVSKLIDASPSNARLVAAGLEIALRRGDYATAARWEDLLKSASSFDDFEWRYYRAYRLVSEYVKLGVDARAELERLIESLRSERPGWLPIVTLRAQYAAAQGNRRDAIDSYQAALKAGDRRAETLEQLVRLLYAEGRFDEAMQFLSRVQADESQKGRFESLAIVAAVQGNRLAEARDLAERAVERGSQDPLHYIWLANITQASGDSQGAQETYRAALQRFPKDVRVWNSVFSHFVQTSQPDRARQTLKRWAEQVPMTEVQKLLVMGQGSESLGDREEAVEFYRQATQTDPQNATARYLLARVLVSTDVNAAREELRRVLEIDPTQAEARRMMALLLSASGDDADWAKAVQYLEGGGDAQSAASATDDERIKAILLARKGKNRQERIANFAAARQMLSNRLERQPAEFSDLDRMLLAGIYEQEAVMGEEIAPLQAARDTLRPMVDRAEAAPESLVSYIQFLLRHVAAPNSSSESDNARELRSIFAEDARLRLDELEKQLAKQPSADRRLATVALRMKLMNAEGRQSEALAILNKAAEQELAGAKTDAERAKIYLQVGNLCGQNGSYAAAENWYRKLEKVAPKTFVLVSQSLMQQGKLNEAVDLCLQRSQGSPSSEIAAVLAQLLPSGKVEPDLNRRAVQYIDAALDADRGNVELLMTVAVLRITRGDDEEAVRMFRRVVELQPKHTLALNNLATLLAERPEQRSEALQYIERAIEIAGRQPALLDTQGTILYHLGRHQEAVDAMEESVSGMSNDPRYYFHLAMAYDGNGQPSDAQQALETALEYGLDKAMLTKGDRELLASLKHNLLTANTQD